MEKILSYCSHCGALNNVAIDQAKLKAPICGKCQQSLPMHGLVSELDLTGMQKIISKSKVPVIVDFWAPWCGPCKMFAPTFMQAADELAGRALFLKVNTQDHPNAGAQYGVRGIPTLIAFKNGAEIQRQSGAMPLEMFKNWMSSFL